jgi:hypothetical protein
MKVYFLFIFFFILKSFGFLFTTFNLPGNFYHSTNKKKALISMLFVRISGKY